MTREEFIQLETAAKEIYALAKQFFKDKSSGSFQVPEEVIKKYNKEVLQGLIIIDLINKPWHQTPQTYIVSRYHFRKKKNIDKILQSFLIREKVKTLRKLGIKLTLPQRVRPDGLFEFKLLSGAKSEGLSMLFEMMEQCPKLFVPKGKK